METICAQKYSTASAENDIFDDLLSVNSIYSPGNSITQFELIPHKNTDDQSIGIISERNIAPVVVHSSHFKEPSAHTTMHPFVNLNPNETCNICDRKVNLLSPIYGCSLVCGLCINEEPSESVSAFQVFFDGEFGQGRIVQLHYKSITDGHTSPIVNKQNKDNVMEVSTEQSIDDLLSMTTIDLTGCESHSTDGAKQGKLHAFLSSYVVGNGVNYEAACLGLFDQVQDLMAQHEQLMKMVEDLNTTKHDNNNQLTDSASNALKRQYTVGPNSGDEAPNSKKQPRKTELNPNAGLITGNRFVHGGRKINDMSTTSMSVKPNTNTPADDKQEHQVSSLAQNKPPKQRESRALDKTSTPLVTGNTQLSPVDTAVITDVNESDDSEFQLVTNNRRKKNDKLPGSANRISTSKSTATKKAPNTTNGSTQPTTATTQQTQQQQPPLPKKPYKKPPPISVFDVRLASSIEEPLAKYKGLYTVRNKGDRVQIFPDSHNNHMLICQALYDAALGFHTHTPLEHKQYRVALKGMDPMQIEEVSDAIHTAVGSRPDRITLATPKRGACFYIVSFKASEVNSDTLSGVYTIGHYRVKWEPYRKRATGPTQCTNCCAFGHGQANCSKVTFCLLCAENHSLYECPIRDSKVDAENTLRRCINCYRNKESNFNHSANSSNCPSRAKFIENRERLADKNNKNKKTPKSHFISRTQTSATEFPDLRRGRSATRIPTVNSISYANAVQNGPSAQQKNTPTTEDNKPFSWQTICAIMATAFTRITSAKTKQEQMHIAFELLAHS